MHALHNYLIGVRKRNLESPNIVGIVGIFFGPLTDFQIKTWRLIIMTTWSLCVIIIFWVPTPGVEYVLLFIILRMT